jgi:hypothetical protein
MKCQPKRKKPMTAIPDFATFEARCASPFFSIDFNRRPLSERELEITQAYLALRLDRDAQHAAIRRELEAHLTSGIWARSTAAYAVQRDDLDQRVVAAARAWDAGLVVTIFQVVQVADGVVMGRFIRYRHADALRMRLNRPLTYGNEKYAVGLDVLNPQV